MHFRNAVGNKYKFNETFHDNGIIDMPDVIRLYQKCGIDVPIRVDHVPLMAGEQEGIAGYTAMGRLYAIGYLKGILDGYDNPPGLDEGCVDPVDGQIRCRAGKASFWITWDGFLTACGMMPQPRVDLTGRAFADAWQALADETAALRLSGVCGRCENRELCHPCAAMASAETGTASGVPQYLCHVAKALRRMADGI